MSKWFTQLTITVFTLCSFLAIHFSPSVQAQETPTLSQLLYEAASAPIEIDSFALETFLEIDIAYEDHPIGIEWTTEMQMVLEPEFQLSWIMENGPSSSSHEKNKSEYYVRDMETFSRYGASEVESQWYQQYLTAEQIETIFNIRETLQHDLTLYLDDLTPLPVFDVIERQTQIELMEDTYWVTITPFETEAEWLAALEMGVQAVVDHSAEGDTITPPTEEELKEIAKFLDNLDYIAEIQFDAATHYLTSINLEVHLNAEMSELLTLYLLGASMDSEGVVGATFRLGVSLDQYNQIEAIDFPKAVFNPNALPLSELGTASEQMIEQYDQSIESGTPFTKKDVLNLMGEPTTDFTTTITYGDLYASFTEVYFEKNPSGNLTDGEQLVSGFFVRETIDVTQPSPTVEKLWQLYLETADLLLKASKPQLVRLEELSLVDELEPVRREFYTDKATLTYETNDLTPFSYIALDYDRTTNSVNGLRHIHYSEYDASFALDNYQSEIEQLQSQANTTAEDYIDLLGMPFSAGVLLADDLKYIEWYSNDKESQLQTVVVFLTSDDKIQKLTFK